MVYAPYRSDCYPAWKSISKIRKIWKGSTSIMKKLASLLLALVLVLGLAACGQKTVTLKILDTEYAIEDYAIAIAKENADLLDKVNAALATITGNGTAQRIVDKYISGAGHDMTFQANAEGKPELHMATNAQFPLMSTTRTTPSLASTRRWLPPSLTSWT